MTDEEGIEITIEGNPLYMKVCYGYYVKILPEHPKYNTLVKMCERQNKEDHDAYLWYKRKEQYNCIDWL